MAEKQVFMSRDSYEKLSKELEQLKEGRKPELSKEIGIAREHGDLKENAEYHAAKEALAHVMKRIHDIENKLSNAVFIEDQNIASDKVYIGATVSLKDMETGREFQYTLVGADEMDIAQGKISVDSPIAQGLLEHKVGDIAEIKVAAGVFKYKILKITR